MENPGTAEKWKVLKERLCGLDSLLVAFSGGVDSTLLLLAAHEALGSSVYAATGESLLHPPEETQRAREFASSLGVDLTLFSTGEMDLPEFVSNDPFRCYHCKRDMFARLGSIAKKRGIAHIAHGANVDDLSDFRPGSRAANEAGILAPLVEASLSKEEIRDLCREKGLDIWDEPASPCLATRISYGTAITEERIRMVYEAESLIRSNGFSKVRVRHHGDVARIEVEPDSLNRFLDEELRGIVSDGLIKIGFRHVALDMEGYSPGSMNRGLGELSE